MLNIESHIELQGSIFKNRIIVPPMASQTADSEGYVTEKTINHYTRLASSKASLIFVEYSYINKNGKSEANQLAINSYDKLFGLKLLSENIQRCGSLAGIQLVHAGAKSTTELTGGYLIAPSSIPTPVKNKTLEVPKEASLKEIKLIENDFVEASKIAIKAGFDVIEIHAAHGYGINQWLSPLTNQRTDSYGGSVEKRALILFNVVKKIKTLFPKIILSVRIPGQDHFDGGMTIEDSIFLSQKLVEFGVDIINVSSGIGGWRRPRTRNGEGYLVEDAYHIQKNLSAPVIGVGGIKTKNYIETELNKGSFSFAAIGRAILNDPEIGSQLLSEQGA